MGRGWSRRAGLQEKCQTNEERKKGVRSGRTVWARRRGGHHWDVPEACVVELWRGFFVVVVMVMVMIVVVVVVVVVCFRDRDRRDLGHGRNGLVFVVADLEYLRTVRTRARGWLERIG